MKIHSRDGKRYKPEEENRMNTSRVHGKNIIPYRQAHADPKDAAVVERESFEEHDARMRDFRCSHPALPGLAAVRTRRSRESIRSAIWETIIPLERDMGLGFSTN
jgi:hypothetical protein